MTDALPEIAPCPVCGCRLLAPAGDYSIDGDADYLFVQRKVEARGAWVSFNVVCMECGAEGPTGDTAEAALGTWALRFRFKCD